ncbi:cupin domain-containing protein [Phenylobacterium sp.]|uniref:cupin domain-containing protein n=1 Tax=Phenylobacterium sp. TaxID=1871053 RepID=UPI0027330E40|nr:cupin domain-containing protein [Phenylobacterium sp.]MDP3855319.1 cupin domain-containing protein [Phenylobacterium sp.]
MALIDLARVAKGLPEAWRSSVVAEIGQARLRVSRMDGSAYPGETHDYREGLLVLEGEMLLSVAGELVAVRTGEVYVVEPGVAHAVAPGSHGVLVIFEA